MNKNLRAVSTAPALGLACLILGQLLLVSCEKGPQPRWWKGNTHTHTLWSDGNGAPESVAQWYTRHGYQFLVLSDHNILSNGEKWFEVSDDGSGRLTDDVLEELRIVFGEDWPEVRQTNGVREMRLRTLGELREMFAAPGEFIFIQGEEITDDYQGTSVHVNGLHLAELVPPQGGNSIRETLQRNVDAVIEQGRRLNRPTLAHINHPNYEWALTAADVAAIEGEQFFEVYNGHSGVRNYGDAGHPGTEAIWDIALTLRLTELNLGLLYGLATDDAHQYYEWGVGNTNPGRGWVMVRARALTPPAIIQALRSGDFYASSGVILEDFRYEADRMVVSIRPETGVTYTTRFRGTRSLESGIGTVGEVLMETTENPAVYVYGGDELYVRATVVSSRLHPNPYAEGDRETAWVQPTMPGVPRR
jgi:hypothetical protein